jgi:hypothetical protein
MHRPPSKYSMHASHRTPLIQLQHFRLEDGARPVEVHQVAGLGALWGMTVRRVVMVVVRGVVRGMVRGMVVVMTGNSRSERRRRGKPTILVCASLAPHAPSTPSTSPTPQSSQKLTRRHQRPHDRLPACALAVGRQNHRLAWLPWRGESWNVR